MYLNTAPLMECFQNHPKVNCTDPELLRTGRIWIIDRHYVHSLKIGSNSSVVTSLHLEKADRELELGWLSRL